MSHRRRSYVAVLGVWAAVCFAETAWGAEEPADSVLKSYADRLPALRAQVPAIVRAAEAAADRRVRDPASHIVIAREPDLAFAYEFVSRAGGLVGLYHERGPRRDASSNGVVLASMPSWENGAEPALKTLSRYRQKGYLIVLFASRSGLATNVPADVVIDNGAATGSAAEETLNVLANASAGWLWCCEYAAALSRLGKRPGILKSISFEDAAAFNEDLKSRGQQLYDSTNAIPPQALSDAYLARLEALVGQIAADPVRTNLLRAADLVADRLRAGQPVFAATCNHLLNPDIYRNVRSGIQPFRPYNAGFQKTLKAGDLLVWFGYIGMDTAHYDHGAQIRATGADFIACFVPSARGAAEAPDAKVVIPQSWELGDAELAIPWPPGRMAPVSGVNQTLLYRMLDAAAAGRLSSPRLQTP